MRLALCELWVRDPLADRYAIFQDDLTCVKNLRGYLDEMKWPVGGYLNLYTGPHHDTYARRYDQTPPPKSGHGWVKSNQFGRESQDITFNFSNAGAGEGFTIQDFSLDYIPLNNKRVTDV